MISEQQICEEEKSSFYGSSKQIKEIHISLRFGISWIIFFQDYIWCYLNLLSLIIMEI